MCHAAEVPTIESALNAASLTLREKPAHLSNQGRNPGRRSNVSRRSGADGSPPTPTYPHALRTFARNKQGIIAASSNAACNYMGPEKI